MAIVQCRVACFVVVLGQDVLVDVRQPPWIVVQVVARFAKQRVVLLKGSTKACDQRIYFFDRIHKINRIRKCRGGKSR